MSGTPVGAKALQVASERSERALALRNQPKKRPKMNILEEDDFVERMDKIIERDFFPYLKTVRKQTEYLDALESRDSVRIAEAEKQLVKGSPQQPIEVTPSKESWDDEDWMKNTPGPSSSNTNSNSINENKLEKDLEGVSLTQFMAKNTSEDNDSFAEIMQTAEQKRRQKLDWVYKHEQEERGDSENTKNNDKALMPPPATPLALLSDKNRISQPLDTWKYKAHNSVMYYPEGAELTEEEVQRLKDGQVKVSHSATRLNTKPWSAPAAQNTATPQAASQATKSDGFWNGVVEKVGIDGKQSWEIPSSPKVNGFSFVATPSPRPGVAESPLMTWGEVDSTPYLIDSSGDASKFRVKEPSVKEQLAYSLAEKVSVAKKKQKAMKTVQDNFAQGKVPQSPRFSALSPAAKRLAVGKLGISRGMDKKLIASYSPSPQQTQKQISGPLSSTVITPFPSPSPRMFVHKTPSESNSSKQNITKAKASDFF